MGQNLLQVLPRQQKQSVANLSGRTGEILKGTCALSLAIRLLKDWTPTRLHFLQESPAGRGIGSKTKLVSQRRNLSPGKRVQLVRLTCKRLRAETTMDREPHPGRMLHHAHLFCFLFKPYLHVNAWLREGCQQIFVSLPSVATLTKTLISTFDYLFGSFSTFHY